MQFQRITLLMLGVFLCCMSSAIAREVTISPMVGGYVFENNLGLKNSPVYTLGLGLNFDQHWSVEGSGDYVETERDGSSTKYNFYSGRIGVLYHFNPVENLTPYVMAGAGALRIDGDDDGQFTYALGAKLDVSDDVALRFEARHVVGIDIDSDHDINDTYNQFAITAGLTFKFGELPATADQYESQAGEVFGAEPASQSQPIVAPLAVPAAVTPAEDSDNDGVIDVLDRCPVTPHGTSVDSEGCPATIKFVDSDDDGVSDALDACSDTPVDVAVDIRGCPLADTDGDGISDVHDNCPGTDSQYTVDEYGCPVLTDNVKTASLVIEYATSQTGFSEEAARELKLLAAKVMSTDQGRLVVEGHTDSVGGENQNLKLSQDRAEKVRQALIKDFDVPENRVVAKGRGPFDPVADNNTQAGRQQNRRVVVRYEP